MSCSRTLVLRWGRGAEEAADLLDGDRPGRPPLFSESTRLKRIAFYCQSPLPGCRGWSVRWAAAYLDEHREILGCAISASSVHRILTAHGLRPHRMKYFLHITDPQFFPKMEALLRLYADPPPTLFCFDECTGLQALDDGKDYLSTIIGGDEKVQQARTTLIEELGARLGMVPRSS